MSSRPLTADGDLLTAYLEDLKLHDYAPLLARLPTGTVHGASGERDASSTSLARFLIRVAQPMAASQGITSMWTDMCQNSLDAPSDEEVHRVLHYCLCLHIVTRELAASPSLARSVLEHQRRALRQTTNWWMYLSAFEHAKLITLERALIFFSRHREGELPIPDNFGRIGLPFNILEAVLQDALIYRKFDNAWAGVPLILARPGRAGRPRRSPTTAGVLCACTCRSPTSGKTSTSRGTSRSRRATRMPPTSPRRSSAHAHPRRHA